MEKMEVDPPPPPAIKYGRVTLYHENFGAKFFRYNEIWLMWLNKNIGVESLLITFSKFVYLRSANYNIVRRRYCHAQNCILMAI